MPLDASSAFDTDRMMAMAGEIMLHIAAQGNAVVVGRGSPFLLREREDTFSVFTYAPHDEKIRRLVAAGRSREEAEDLVENVDKERMAYIKHYFNNEWPTRSLYHLMINTAVGDENVVATILSCMQTFAAHPGEIALRGIR
jgi:cytidylate kinase